MVIEGIDGNSLIIIIWELFNFLGITLNLVIEGKRKRVLEQIFIRPYAIPDINHMHGMHYQIVKIV